MQLGIRRSTVDRARYMLVAYVMFHALFTLFGQSQFEQGSVATRALNVGTPLIGAALCLLPALSLTERRERASWWFLSLGLAASALAESIWEYYAIVEGGNPPAVSVADLAYGLYYPFTFVGLMFQCSRRSDRTTRLTATLDALLFSVAAAGLIWHFIAEPFIAQAEHGVGLPIGLSYPVGDLLLLSALVSLVLRLPLARVPAHVAWLVLSLLALVLADLWHLKLILEGSYAAGRAVDILWSISYAGTGLAAVRRFRSEEAQTDDVVNFSWTAGARLLLPYLAAPAALLIMWDVDGYAHESMADELVLIGVMAGLILARQFVALFENGRLAASLAKLSHELERRVADRTRELTHLNDVSTQLSRCLSFAEVLATGLDLVCRATGATVGVVWLRAANGDLSIAARRGLDARAESVLAEITALWAQADHEPVSPGPSVAHLMDFFPNGVPTAALDGLPPELLLAPLLSRRATLGMVGLGRAAAQQWQPTDLQLAHSIGAQWGVALENARRYESVAYLADRDPVTELLNHRAAHRAIAQEVERAGRSGGCFAVLILDLDNFKLFNDTYGHPVGDRVLREVGIVLTEQKRAYDVVGRYGGDEYLVLLPDTGLDGALAFAERARAALRERPYLNAEGAEVPVRGSFGIAVYPDSGGSVNELVARADTNLYESKLHGGDTVYHDASNGDAKTPKVSTFGVLDALVTAIDRRDCYTRRHSEDVTRIALDIAQSLGLSDQSERTLRIAGLLHDVGKIGVPNHILRKPGRLDEGELAIVRQHVEIGEMIIKEVPHLNEVLAAVSSHHERYDGAGYPRGLKGEEIPLLGRILAVADCYSAMTTDRPYRQALTPEQAQSELRRVAGAQVDPMIVAALLNTIGAPAGIRN
ncbi:MAG: diguanylate cyclase [Chloroflexota bacterium]